MRLIIEVIVVSLIVCGYSVAQQQKIPVSVLRAGHDEIGSMFAASISRELVKSTRYKLMSADQQKLGADKPDTKILETTTKGLEFYIELSTIAGDKKVDHNLSAISVVIESMGLPNSWPVANMWYHKVILVHREQVDSMAAQLLTDMDAHWCRTIKNSNDGCPKELWDPQ